MMEKMKPRKAQRLSKVTELNGGLWTLGPVLLPLLVPLANKAKQGTQGAQ